MLKGLASIPSRLFSLVLEGGEIGVFTTPVSTLTVLTTFKPERALSLPGGPLSWFMTSLFSLIYQAQRAEDGCLVSYARYH